MAADELDGMGPRFLAQEIGSGESQLLRNTSLFMIVGCDLQILMTLKPLQMPAHDSLAAACY